METPLGRKVRLTLSMVCFELFDVLAALGVVLAESLGPLTSFRDCVVVYGLEKNDV